MATATRPVSPNAVYPAEAVSRLFAPPEAEFVCLEPMTAPTAGLTTGATPLVAPGDRFSAQFTIEVEDA